MYDSLSTLAKDTAVLRDYAGQSMLVVQVGVVVGGVVTGLSGSLHLLCDLLGLGTFLGRLGRDATKYNTGQLMLMVSSHLHATRTEDVRPVYTLDHNISYWKLPGALDTYVCTNSHPTFPGRSCSEPYTVRYSS